MTRKHRKFVVAIEGDFPESLTVEDIQRAVMFELGALSHGIKIQRDWDIRIPATATVKEKDDEPERERKA